MPLLRGSRSLMLWSIGAAGISTPVGADALLIGEDDGLAIDFTYHTTSQKGDAKVKDTTTQANIYNGEPEGLLTYTSPSLKMTMHDDGLIKHVKHNLHKRSEDPANWATKTAMTNTSGDYNFNNIAFGTLTSDSGVGGHSTSTGNQTPVKGVTYRYSWIVNTTNSTSAYLLVLANGGFGNPSMNVNLATGAAGGSGQGSPLNITSTALGEGYFQITFEAVSTATTNGTLVFYTSDDGLWANRNSDIGATTIVIGGNQINKLPSDLTYVETTASPTQEFELPYEWGYNDDGVGSTDNLESKGVLIEEARTNLMTESTEFLEAGNWAHTGITLSASSETDPAGGLLAIQFSNDDETTESIGSFTAAGSGSVCLSVYAKVGVGPAFLALRYDDATATGVETWFDLTAGTIGTDNNDDSGMIAVGNGWYRCWVKDTSEEATGTFNIRLADADASTTEDTSDTMHLWGAQAEAGAFPTSHILTGDATVTRAEDNVLLLTSATPVPGMEASGDEMSMFTESSIPIPTTANTILRIDDNTDTDRIMHGVGSTSAHGRLLITANNVTVNATEETTDLTAVTRMASRYAENDSQGYINGKALTTDATTALTATAFSHIRFGRDSTAGQNTNGHIRKVSVLPRGKTDAELKADTVSSDSGASLLGYGESSGLFIDFTTNFETNVYGSTLGDALIRDSNQLTTSHVQPSDMLTFTSPSKKTVLAEDGLLKYSPHNLCLWSETFQDAVWTTNSATVTDNSDTAPDGTTTACTMDDATATAQFRTQQDFTVVNGTPHVFSVYAKQSTGAANWLLIDTVDVGVTNHRTWYDLSTGTVGTTASGNTGAMEDVGNGWWRCTSTRTVDSTSYRILLGMNENDNETTYVGTGANAILLWGATVSETPAVDTYLPTVAAAKYELPYEWQLDHEGVPTRAGILVEVARTNLIPDHIPNGTDWTDSDVTITASTETDPSGGTAAAECTNADTTTALSDDFTSAGSGSVTCSVYAKAGVNSPFLRLIYDDSIATQSDTWFDLVNGTVGTIEAGIDAADMEAVGNGWYRCWITDTSEATDSTFFVNNSTTDAGSTEATGDSLHIWGAQAEAGAFPTSLIPTYGATVARAQDQIEVALSATPLPDLTLAAHAISAFSETDTSNTAVTGRILQIDDGSSADRIMIQHNTGDFPQLFMSTSDVGGAGVSTSGPGKGEGERQQVSARYAEDDYSVAWGDLNVGTDAAADVIGDAITTINIGSASTGTLQPNTHISRVSLVPRGKSDAELASDVLELAGSTSRTGADLLLTRPVDKRDEQQGVGMDFQADFATGANDYDGSFRGDMAIRWNRSTQQSGTPYTYLTYTSPSVKMTRQQDGFLKFQAYNLLLQSEDFSTTWALGQSTVTTNDTTAPDGTTTADKVTEDSNNNIHAVRQVLALTGPATRLYQASCYFKAGTTNYVAISMMDQANEWASAVFDLSAVTVSQTQVGATSGQLNDTSIESVGNDWYRCTVIGNGSFSGSGETVYIGLSDSATPTIAAGNGMPTWTGTTTLDAYMWGAQISEYPAEPTYVKTTTVAKYELPYQWDVNNEAEGILIEQQAVQRSIQSHDMTAGGWAATNVTVATTTEVSPTGSTFDAFVITASTDGSDVAHHVQDGFVVDASVDDYCFSIYVKKGTSDFAYMETVGAVPGIVGAYSIDLRDGTQAQEITAASGGLTIEDAGNGWYRCSIVDASDGDGGNPQQRIAPHDGGADQNYTAAGETIFVYGPQVEIGPSPSSHIVAWNIGVTRANDNITLEISDTPLTGLAVSGEEMSIFADFQAKKDGISHYPISIDDGDNTDHVECAAAGSGGNSNVTYTSSGGIDDGFSGNLRAIVDGEDYSVGMRFIEDDMAAYDSAGNSGTDATLDLMGSALTTIRLGNFLTNSHMNNPIRKISLLPRGKTNTELSTETGN